MAASVRIDDGAFGDPRFELLGSLLGTSRYDALGRCAHLWRHCTDQQTKKLPASIVSVFVSPDKLIAAGLAERVDDDVLRIRGTKGRIEWLGKLRKNARKGGLARASQKAATRQPKGNPDGSQEPAKSQPNPSVTVTAPVTAPAPVNQDRDPASTSDAEPPAPEQTEKRSQGPTPAEVTNLAERAIRYLNARTGRRGQSAFRAGKTTTDNVRRLMRAGHGVEAFRAVIDAKVRQWGSDERMADQLKPTVLFRPSNFARYLEVDTVPPPPRGAANGHGYRPRPKANL